jgi:hypothetical protein
VENNSPVIIPVITSPGYPVIDNEGYSESLKVNNYDYQKCLTISSYFMTNAAYDEDRKTLTGGKEITCPNIPICPDRSLLQGCKWNNTLRVTCKALENKKAEITI